MRNPYTFCSVLLSTWSCDENSLWQNDNRSRNACGKLKLIVWLDLGKGRMFKVRGIDRMEDALSFAYV